MKGSLYSIVFYFLVPIAIKICVGLVQLSIIIEITLRVRESINTYRVVNSKKKLNAQKMINEVLANQKKSDRKVLILQICIIIFCIAFLTWVTITSVKHAYRYNGSNPVEANAARMNRIEFTTKMIQRMTFGFLFLTIGLFISVIVLVRNLAIGNRRVSDLPSVFKSETQHLSFILIFFSFTYMVRFIFDYWVTPAITSSSSLYPCIRDDELPTVCGSSYSI